MKTDFHLLVDSEEFIDDLEVRILKANDRVLIQSMTFEADKAGMRLYEALRNSSATEKILCVDAYALANINDGWAYGWRYLTNSTHRKEVDDTRKILKSSGKFGIQVVVTNPLGFLGLKYPFRNHKKIMVVDEVAYLGGINFSEHNFAWHDFMVRISDQEIVKKLASDFSLTCLKKNLSSIYSLRTGRLYFLDGSSSKEEYKRLFGEILKAKKRVTILSPYVSDPLLSNLWKLDNSVGVTIITPKQNNKSFMKNGLYDALKGSDFNLFEYQPAMSHMKAILIDDKKLIVGSSNFDVVSYHLEQEVVLVSEDAVLIKTFKERILEVDMAKSERVDLTTRRRAIGTWFIMIMLKKVVTLLGIFHIRRP